MEAFAGGVITVNPGEMHDGIPAGGCVRHWRMLYFDPACLVADAAGAPRASGIQKPKVCRDPGLAELVHSLFRHVAGDGDALAVEVI